MSDRSASERHCPSCVCGKRAQVQADPTAFLPESHSGRVPGARHAGTIAWSEHEEAWASYASKHGRSQSAQSIADRGGFGYGEIVALLGREPSTWAPAGAVAERERTT